MKITTKIKQLIAINLALLLVVVTVAVSTTLPAAAAPATLSPGQGRIKLVCDAGRAFQTIVVTADVQGIATSGVTFVAGNDVKTKPYGTGIVQARFPETSRGNVDVYAQYVTSDTVLHSISFQGKSIVTVAVTACP